MRIDPHFPTTLLEGPLAKALIPFSWVYGAAALLGRRWRAAHAESLEKPVVSIGNITCGGTGKTPVVEMVARDLLQLGRKPAILSRGYGATRSRSGGGFSHNDEYLVLRANLPQVPHLQGKERVVLGREAIRQGADVLILDDGFQHVRLKRDVDIVLIDALAPFGFGRVLPAGLLREPLGALCHATLFGITRCDQIEPRTLSTLRSYLRCRFPEIPQVQLSTRPLEWVGIDGKRASLESLSGRAVLAFCGIGNPEAFRRQIVGLGLDVRAFVRFRDHHAYSRQDIAILHQRMLKCAAVEVVMTQKDAVKIPHDEATAAWKHLRIETLICAGDDVYRVALRQALESRPHAS